MQSKLPDGATIAPIILSSDKTQLSVFGGDKAAWPVYITIGNVAKGIRRQPSMHGTLLLGYLSDSKLGHILNEKSRSLALKWLFHDQMRYIITPLIQAGKDGMEMVCADGNIRLVYPILASYVCDHPEQCLVACIKHSHCPICEVPPKKRGLLAKFPLRRRQNIIDSIKTRVKIVQSTVSGNEKDNSWKSKVDAKNFTRLGLRPINPFWMDLPLVDGHTLFTPDILHQLHKGMFQVHLLSWMKKMMTAEEIDKRFKAITSYPGLRHFKNGVSHISQMSGKEQKELQKVLMIVIAGHTRLPKKAIIAASGLLNFIYLARYPVHNNHTLKLMEDALRTFHANKKVFLDHKVCLDFDGIPKLHSLMHYTDSIRSKGTADGYSTESPERLHIDFAKKGYRASNKNDFLRQMVRWLVRQEAMNYQRAYLAWCKGYTSFIDCGGGINQLDGDDAWDLDKADTRNDDQVNASIQLCDSNSLPSILDLSASSVPMESEYRIAKKPNVRHQTFQDIERRYKIVDFYWYFHDYFKQFPGQEVDKAYDGGQTGLDIWNGFWLAIPQLKDVSLPSLWHKISAVPESQKVTHLRGSQKVSENFSTVLVLHDRNAEGLESEYLTNISIYSDRI